jgi:hypothetical protein
MRTRLVIRAGKRLVDDHARRFNVPSTDDLIAIAIAGNEFDRRDIVLEKKNNQLQRVVAETCKSYDALQYPLLFWAGEDGYHFLIPKMNPRSGIPVDGKRKYRP